MDAPFPNPSPPVLALRAGAAAALLCILAAWTTTELRHPEGHGAARAELPSHQLVQALVQYDSGWYGEISDKGYWRVPPNTQSPTAFFPLYPMLMYGGELLGLHRFVAGVLITLLCGLGALLLFAKWATLLKPAHARSAVLLLALYPFSIYLYGVVYADALFLVLAVGAFYALERRNLALATVLGMLATATRPVAPAMVVGLVVRNAELQRANGEKWGIKTVLPAFAALGMALYMAYLQQKVGDALAFAHAQSAPGWDNAPGLHTWLKVEFFKALRNPMGPMHVLRLLAHATTALVALLLVIPTKKHLGWGYAAYCAVAVGMPSLSSHDFQGLGRYVIAAFPLFLTAVMLLRARPRLLRAGLIASAVLLIFLACAFGDGQYVA